jgi:hypothetical protein
MKLCVRCRKEDGPESVERIERIGTFLEAVLHMVKESKGEGETRHHNHVHVNRRILSVKHLAKLKLQAHKNVFG